MSEQVFSLALSFIKQEPRAAARFLEKQDVADVAGFLQNSPQHLAVAVVREMLPSTCAQVLLETDLSAAMLWLGELTNNHLCAILRHVPSSNSAEFLEQLSFRRRTACRRLLAYDSNSLGAWVETDVPVFPGDMSAGEALKRLKLRKFTEDRLILVVDDQRRPTGALSLLTLVRSSKSVGSIDGLAQPVGEVINGWVTLSSAVGHSVWKSQDFVAVVDLQRELLGVIWYSRIRQLLSAQSEMTETNKAPPDGRYLDLIHAYGESMRAMLETVKAGIN